MAAEGGVEDRQDVFDEILKLGMEIPRAGQKYLTIMDPESGKRWRMKGVIYERNFQIERALEAVEQETAAGSTQVPSKRVAELECQLERVRAKRAEYNRHRYPAKPEALLFTDGSSQQAAGEADAESLVEMVDHGFGIGPVFLPPRDDNDQSQQVVDGVLYGIEDGASCRPSSGASGTGGKPSASSKLERHSPSGSEWPMAVAAGGHAGAGSRDMGSGPGDIAGAEVTNDGVGNDSSGRIAEVGARVDRILEAAERASRGLAAAVECADRCLRGVVRFVAGMKRALAGDKAQDHESDQSGPTME